jgi:ABC-type uncharacterized transport system substrate-binding protein
MAAAQPIAVIMTAKAAAYEKVANKIRAELGGQVHFYDMKDSRKHDDNIVAKVTAQNPSLVISLGDKAAHMAAEKLSAYPILIGMVLDLDQPAFKVPGIEGVGLQIAPKSVLTQLGLIVPQFKRIGVVSSNLKFASLRQEIRAAASEFGIQMVEIIAADKKKPLVVFSENFVRAGALFSVSPDYEATGQQIVVLAKKMLAKEVVRPTEPYLAKFHYPIGTYSVLNKKTAKKIGLELTQMQLAFIDRIINGK